MGRRKGKGETGKRGFEREVEKKTKKGGGREREREREREIRRLMEVGYANNNNNNIVIGNGILIHNL